MFEDTNVKASDTFYMTLKAAMNLPSVQIRRDDFLRKELSMHFSKEIVDLAIKTNPANAGITISEIESISKGCIKYETNKVTAISVAAGIPGGFAMIGTIPADAIQYFGHIVRILQKLIYLYGWKELYNEDGEFDDETTNVLTLFIGVMFGVQAANTAVVKIASSAALKLEKSLEAKALTKGIIYPIVKKVAQILGVKMTKDTFAKGVSKIVPVIGGVISGGLTYATFRPSSLKLKKHLENLPNADVDFYKNEKKKDGYVDIKFNNSR